MSEEITVENVGKKCTRGARGKRSKSSECVATDSPQSLKELSRNETCRRDCDGVTFDSTGLCSNLARLDIYETDDNLKCSPVQKATDDEILVQLHSVSLEKSAEEQQKHNAAGRKRRSRSSKQKNISINDATDDSLDLSTSDTGQQDKKNAGTPSKPGKKKEKFSEHIPLREMQKILEYQDPKKPQFIEGYLRINPRFYKHAYLSMPAGDADLLIVGLRDRNRAFEGDLVVALINPETEWHVLSDGQKQKTGMIVCILEKVHPRKAIGYLKKQGPLVLLHPRDQRVPLLKIHPTSLPPLFEHQPVLFEDMLFLASIESWNIPQLAVGKIEQMIGVTGNLQAETTAILLENDLDVTPYDEELMKDLPSNGYVPTPSEMEGREDWRRECVFTIDPSTAVDLDDAVSCKVLDNGNFEIGVHISDVTHYLEFCSPLDTEVSKRATTVYMTDSVYHMLPQQLCQVCSLLPGQDKLAFSVIWEMTPDADIVKHRFVKTVINSCCQMAYEHAQKMIENPTKQWPEDFLRIKGNFTVSQLSETVNHLFKLSVKMRDRRFADGALRIDQPKLHVLLDRTTKLPVSYYTDEQKDSNRLIEEFMLLANMTVATHLYNTIPDSALLRSHEEPSERMLTITRDMLQKFGIHLDIESSKSLQNSIKRYESDLYSECEKTRQITRYRMMVINNMCSKAMMRAKYKCSSTVIKVEDLKHYALNVPLYTHFTSPIRRYSDCVVHRLLYATIRGIPLPKNWTAKLCTQIAANCNLKKYSAKMAQEQSSELYFTYLIDLTGPFTAVGIVLDVRERSIDVILCNVGIKLRVYLAEIEESATVKYSTDYSVPTLIVYWRHPVVTQVITLFTLVHLRIEKHQELFRLNGTLLPPL